MAAVPASRISAGVGKSGSPTSRWMMDLPARSNSWAFSITSITRKGSISRARCAKRWASFMTQILSARRLLSTRWGTARSFRQVVDAERLVGDEEHHHITIRARPVLHHFPFGKPDERARAVGALVGHQPSLEDEHSVAAGVRVPGVDHSRRIAHQPDLGAVVRIRVEDLPEESPADPLVEALLPGNDLRVDRIHLAWIHTCPSYSTGTIQPARSPGPSP